VIASVVTAASVAGHTGVPHHAHYGAAKAGLIKLTKSAARALAPRVRVNCVARGMTLTEMDCQSATALPAGYGKTRLLTHRFAEPEEIARLIAFVASPVAGFMTGATIDINGGRILR
jgi:3-oxoacyl-[acyl-carrier protein] reductase